MINIYKKVEKTKQNLSGYIEISENEIEKPFLLCISAQDNHDKSIFGTIRQGVQAARVYTMKDNGARYKIEKFPIDFLGFKFIKDNEYNDNAHEIVEKFIYPYLIKNGLNKENLIEKARKINFMTYCDGTETYRKIERELIEYLNKDGLNKNDIDSIISNIHLVSIGTQVNTSNFKCTSISLIDSNDEEIYNNLTNQVQKIMKNRNIKSLFGQFNDNNGYYYYDGTGRHQLTEYFRDGVLIKPILCFVISKILEASIQGKKITLNDIINELKKITKNGINQEELLSIIDNTINFGDAPKYSYDELRFRIELDEIYSLYSKEHDEKEKLIKSNENKSQTIQRIVEGIKKYSSDITFLQILVKMGYWQAPSGINPYEFPSDREVRKNILKNEIDNNLKL